MQTPGRVAKGTNGGTVDAKKESPQGTDRRGTKYSITLLHLFLISLFFSSYKTTTERKSVTSLVARKEGTAMDSQSGSTVQPSNQPGISGSPAQASNVSERGSSSFMRGASSSNKKSKEEIPKTS